MFDVEPSRALDNSIELLICSGRFLTTRKLISMDSLLPQNLTKLQKYTRFAEAQHNETGRPIRVEVNQNLLYCKELLDAFQARDMNSEQGTKFAMARIQNVLVMMAPSRFNDSHPLAMETRKEESTQALEQKPPHNLNQIFATTRFTSITRYQKTELAAMKAGEVLYLLHWATVIDLANC